MIPLNKSKNICTFNYFPFLTTNFAYKITALFDAMTKWEVVMHHFHIKNIQVRLVIVSSSQLAAHHFFLCMPSSKKIFYSISRRDLQTGIPKIDTISGHEKKEKETYFLLFSTPYCEEMLVVLSIVPTKAAFCLMTNEQRNCFPETSKMWVTRSFTLMSVFTPLVVVLLLLHLSVNHL